MHPIADQYGRIGDGALACAPHDLNHDCTVDQADIDGISTPKWKRRVIIQASRSVVALLLLCVGCQDDGSTRDDAEPSTDASVDQRRIDQDLLDATIARDMADARTADQDLNVADAQSARPTDMMLEMRAVDMRPVDMAAPLDWRLPDALRPPRPSTCPDQRGMIGVPFPDGRCYLMDPWPVTQGEYLAALATGPLRSGHAACEGHVSSGPRSDEVETSGSPYCFVTVRGCMVGDDLCERVDRRMPWPPSDDALDEPMVCVSWCDADAYCEQVGKRLCSSGHADAGEPYSVAALTDLRTDEMFNACLAGGQPTFPAGLRGPWYTDRGRPLARANIAIEGGWEGLFGLPVTLEWRGPFYDALLGSVLAPDLPCAALPTDVWTSAQRGSFGGFATFRCCADAD